MLDMILSRERDGWQMLLQYLRLDQRQKVALVLLFFSDDLDISGYPKHPQFFERNFML